MDPNGENDLYTLAQANRYATACHDQLYGLLDDLEFAPGRRSGLILAYVSIMLEHQRAIQQLVNANLRGSALALLRPQVETAFRGLWVGRIATDEQVERIAESGATPFGSFKMMAAKLDSAYSSGGEFAAIAEGWELWCGFAHSGLEQLGRRFNENGTLTPAYSDEESAALLMFSGQLSLITTFKLISEAKPIDKLKALACWSRIKAQIMAVGNASDTASACYPHARNTNHS